MSLNINNQVLESEIKKAFLYTIYNCIKMNKYKLNQGGKSPVHRKVQDTNKS